MKYYIIHYKLTIGDRRIVQHSKPIKAIFGWIALLKFKHKVKHNKSFERKIIAVKKISKKEAIKNGTSKKI